jgi:hypothetical protein
MMATPSTQKANTWRGKLLVRSSMKPREGGKRRAGVTGRDGWVGERH